MYSPILRSKTSVRTLLYAIAITILVASGRAASAVNYDLKTYQQVPVTDFPELYHRIAQNESWDVQRVALIICDMWDSHHCVNAVRRVHEIAPRIDELANSMRQSGATIIHAPSGCMNFYKSHPARIRVKSVPGASNLPKDLDRWCDQIPSEEKAHYPVDQSDGGEDDDPVEHRQWATSLQRQERDPRRPWKCQIETIRIDDERDYVSDSGNEVWNILEKNKIEHVLVCGVHTNMCVLGRPFGLRQLTRHGKHALLVRDLTDTMYNPQSWPFVNHFSGTDLVIDHVERYVCSTISSDELFRAAHHSNSKYQTPHRFAADRRPHVAILIAEDEYETANTLPIFAAEHLQTKLKVSLIYGDTKEKLVVPGISAIADADALLVSVRRKPLKKEDLDVVRRFVYSGKPVLGIRTASHAFSLRNGESPGLEQWKEYDAYTHGGNYTNHYSNKLITSVRGREKDQVIFTSKGSLYKVSPLLEGTEVRWFGSVPDQPEEPVAWSFIRADGGSSFYTSLGHKSDFEQPAFIEMLTNEVFSRCNVQGVTRSEIEAQQTRYRQGKGKQRK
jgi:nicotinamidase-related amidase